MRKTYLSRTRTNMHRHENSGPGPCCAEQSPVLGAHCDEISHLERAGAAGGTPNEHEIQQITLNNQSKWCSKMVERHPTNPPGACRHRRNGLQGKIERSLCVLRLQPAPPSMLTFGSLGAPYLKDEHPGGAVKIAMIF